MVRSLKTKSIPRFAGSRFGEILSFGETLGPAENWIDPEGRGSSSEQSSLLNLQGAMGSRHIVHRRRQWVWLGGVVGVGLVAAAVWLPPFLPEAWRPAVMAVFSPACHQLPARSPHLDGVQLAVCDRCLGIYIGAFVGVLLAGGLRPVWSWLGEAGRYLLLGALIPLGVDWIAPLVGLWSNTPVSRGTTGALFGLVAALFTMTTLLRRAKTEYSSSSVRS